MSAENAGGHGGTQIWYNVSADITLLPRINLNGHSVADTAVAGLSNATTAPCGISSNGVTMRHIGITKSPLT